MMFQSINISLNTFQQSLCMHAMRAYSLQSCPTLCDPMDRGAWQGYSPWGRKESDTTERLTLPLPPF